MLSPGRCLTVLLALLSVLHDVLSGPCGPSGVRCIQGKATCDDGLCVCNGPKYPKGDGTFMCYRKNQVAAEVRNDPELTTYNNETVQFHYPCRYMLGHVRQQLKDRQRNVIGACEFQVYGFNKKHRGKVYVHGFDAALKLEFDDGTEAFSVRNYGTRGTGRTFEGVRDKFWPHGPWAMDNVNYTNNDFGIYIYNYYDPVNKQMVLEAPQCGLRVTFVPYDEILGRNSRHIPGLSVAVNCAHRPIWLSRHLTMGLPPVWQRGHLFADIQYPFLTVQQSVVVRAFESAMPQVQPDAANECTTGQAKIAACDDSTRAQAMSACFWMLQQPRFIKCLDVEGSVTNLLTLFTECVRTFCQPMPDSMTCRDVVDAVTALGCASIPRIPVLTLFASYGLCPSLA